MAMRPRTAVNGPRRGVTMIELVVVMAILGLLAAIILPAVQWTRHRASRLTCQSHLRQLGIAFQSYTADHRAFPVQNNPLIRLLPYLEQGDLYRKLDSQFGSWILSNTAPVPDWPSHGLTVFLCPSDERANPSRGESNYLLNDGRGFEWKDGILMRNGWTQPRDVTDGLSQTVFMAERLVEVLVTSDAVAHRQPHRYIWYVPRQYRFWTDIDRFVDDCRNNRTTALPTHSNGSPRWLESTHGYNHLMTPNSPPCANGTPTDAWLAMGKEIAPATSQHTGCCNVLFADGSVRTMANSIDLAIWRAMGTRAGSDFTDGGGP